MTRHLRLRISAIVAVLLPLTHAVAATAVSGPAQVREQILANLEKSALYRSRVDWPESYERLRASGNDQQADQLVYELISKSTGGHGFWVKAGASSKAQSAARVLSNGGFHEILLPSTPAKSANRGVGPGHIAWIEVAAFKEDIGSTPGVKREQKLGFAESLQNVIRAQDEEGACGWIVDLRNNSGGNMWPMLLGLAPLLSNEEGSATTVGHFSTASGPQSWEVQPNSVALMGRQILNLNGPGYRLRHQNKPVAVLLGRSTASSGEAVGLAFRGSSRFRSFGQRTAGYSTGNRPVPLADGSFLLLTETVMLDRKAQGSAGPIVPEVEFDDHKEAEASARSWLLSRASCRRVPLWPHP